MSDSCRKGRRRTMEIKTVSIVGLGALGIMYGKHLVDRIGNAAVRIVADKERIERYKKEDIFCNGERCDFQYIDVHEDCEPADLLIFAVKYSGLEDAIVSAKNQVGENTIILSLLNGITSENVIGKVYGFEKILYCVAQGMDAVKRDNQLTYVNLGLLSFGEGNGEKSEKVKALSTFFDKVKIPYEIPENMMHKLWSKLMLNTGVNQTVAVFKTNYGGIQIEGKPRDTVIGAMKEVMKVAQKEGINLDENEIRYWLEVIDCLHPMGMPSMRQDTEAHRKTEVELFAGTIISLGKKHGIPTPINDFLYKEIKALEASYDLSQIVED